MNTQDRVNERIAKVALKNQEIELNLQKIELGASDDLKELVTEAKRIINLQEDGFKWGERAEKEFKEVKKLISDAEGITRGAIRQAANLKKDSDKIFNKIEVLSKELGINTNSIKEYDVANKLINKMFDNQNSLTGYNDMLKKLL